MLIVETIAKIRRLHFTEGKGIKTICRDGLIFVDFSDIPPFARRVLPAQVDLIVDGSRVLEV